MRRGRRLGEGPRLGIREVIALGDELLAVLEYLHSRVPPVFHRDIKPSNLIVGTDGRVSLVDFGVAASGWRGLDAATIVGTPGYTAPEQFSGIAIDRIDEDVFAPGGRFWSSTTPRIQRSTGLSSSIPPIN